MPFNWLDYTVIAAYVAIMVIVGYYSQKRGQEDLEDYFTGGKNLPWWLIGVSMVATTFAADTPLAVTGIIATEGIAGNWIWWNFMFSGLITVFLYAKLWKRADVITDVEFISIRYTGKPARILRGFRSLYLAFPINCIILGWVTVGMAKILTVLTGAGQWEVIIIMYVMIGVYIAFSGLWGVIVTDFIQFILAMFGTIMLAWYAVDFVGGLDGLQAELTALYGEGHTMLSINPLNSPEIAIATALVWVGMMWWASWYPGSEPGGGGYIAQRMFSAKDETNAVGGTLLFNVAHFALRPWPWILVALVALVVYPGLDDPETGYPLLMLKLLPAGLLGLLAVAFLAAFVSTVSTHLNWGASYVVNDFYKPFLKPESDFESKAAAQKHYVMVSRWTTLLMMVAAVIVSLLFDTVRGGWEAILSIGAGTGLVYMLRWFWWRINAWSEISAMTAAAIGSFLAPAIGFDDFASKMIFTTIFATIIWVAVTFITKPDDEEVLQTFFDRVKPGGPGWKRFMRGGEITYSLLPGLGYAAISAVSIIAFLYGMGQIFFESALFGFGAFGVGIAGIWFVVKKI
ncbi:sodium:solute symporter family protein [Rhodohalobacter sp. 8-1]|uniref:sodium:solute symporter family protein n=1 Tax=Rhodohalobacter sp. 8-1 TaxID=3131972 RepID=UPI0030EF4504